MLYADEVGIKAGDSSRLVAAVTVFMMSVIV